MSLRQSYIKDLGYVDRDLSHICAFVRGRCRKTLFSVQFFGSDLDAFTTRNPFLGTNPLEPA